MKRLLLCFTGLALSISYVSAKNNNDPVLMTVAGKDVPRSEFEYLYHKNNSQQAEPMTIDQYVGMFINYKLKVADAEAAGIDTTSTFLSEFSKFRNELSEPYLKKTDVDKKLESEVYGRMLEEVTVSHIMVDSNNEPLIDSIYTELKNGKASFEEMAQKFSIDKPTATRGGYMGVVTAGRFPYTFESAAYNTPVGEISPVVNSGFGLHIVRVENRRPARGQVRAAHILRRTRGQSDEGVAKQRHIIDSIYEIVSKKPEMFNTIATTMSEDPGSARRGGELGWFGPGQMVVEFDSVAFAMPVGVVSKPFKTDFGWHIIYKEEAKPVGSFEDNAAEIEAIIKNTERAEISKNRFLEETLAKYNAHLLSENIAKISGLADGIGSELDSAMIAELSKIDLPIFEINKKSIKLDKVLSTINPVPVKGGNAIKNFISDSAEKMMNDMAIDMARNNLEKDNDEYRNLVNEYRDGILLFEISNQKVWDKASKDVAGLNEFFQNNKSRYSWTEPRFKAVVIFSTSDSILTAAMNYAATLPVDLKPTDFVQQMKNKFGKDIKIERVIAAKGENAITDYLGFGMEKPTLENNRWNYYSAFNGRIIDSPEEPSDVRGAAVSDYQETLEKEWLSDLHKKYKVKVNKSVLKTVK